MSTQATIPGCPTIRALAFNESGVIEVIESDVERPRIARVVEKWGDPDSSKSVVATSLTDGNLNRELTFVQQPPVQQPQNVGDGEGTDPFTHYIQSP